jgi:hypothetical protein
MSETGSIEWRGEGDRAPECFACGRAYSRGDGRFCTTKCRDAYDAGFPAYTSTPTLRYGGPLRVVAGGAPGYLPKMPMKATARGFKIRCAGCQKEFESLGLRCCSPRCEQKYRERQDIAAVMAEAGMEPSAKRKCVECGVVIPRYVGVGKKRRATPVTRNLCSPKCRKKYRLALGSQTDVLTAEGL